MAAATDELLPVGHIDGSTASSGSVVSIAALNTYVARAASADSKKAILFFTDIFGFSFENSRLMADHFAAQGFTTYVPDFFEGDGVKPGDSRDLMMALIGRHPMDHVKPLAAAVIKELRTVHGVERLGCVGYCWGGRLSILSGHAGAGCDAIVAAHPSFVVVPDEIDAITARALFLCAGEDASFPPAAVSHVRSIAAERDWAVHEFPGTAHGFAVRGDLAVPHIRSARVAALQLALDFFRRQL